MAVDVDDLGVSFLSDPLLIRPIEMHVPVQPQGRMVPVDEVEERFEAYVGHILLVPETERRGVGGEDTWLRTADEAPVTAATRPSSGPGMPAPQDAGRERPRPAAHLTLGILVGTA